MFLGSENLLIKDRRIERQVIYRISAASALPTCPHTPTIIFLAMCFVNFKGNAQTLDTAVVSYFLPILCGKKTPWAPQQHVLHILPFTSPHCHGCELDIPGPNEELCPYLRTAQTHVALKQLISHFLMSALVSVELKSLQSQSRLHPWLSLHRSGLPQCS